VVTGIPGHGKTTVVKRHRLSYWWSGTHGGWSSPSSSRFRSATHKRWLRTWYNGRFRCRADPGGIVAWPITGSSRISYSSYRARMTTLPWSGWSKRAVERSRAPRR